MPRPPVQTDQLRNVLTRRGVTSSGELTRELAISRPTLAKLVAALGSSVVSFGNARATRYGLRRILAAGLANPLRLYRVELLEAYSVFILNTDRHFGNLSFFTDYLSGPLTLTPAYDVLPMALAPSRSGYIPHLPEHTPIITGRMAIASQALIMAQDFWQSVVSSEWVSEEMQSMAKEMVLRLSSG